MDSGIYQLTFPNGQFYIGKSETIQTRWKNHKKNFESGTHTKKMQLAYNEQGQPEYEIVLQVHPEHIGIFESIWINLKWSNQILNTTKPKPLTSDQIKRYLNAYDTITFNQDSCMLYSTLDHVEQVEKLLKQVKAADLRIEQLETTGIVIPDEWREIETMLKRRSAELIVKLSNTQAELDRFKRMTLFQRIFNFK